MYRIFICDDEPRILSDIEKTVRALRPDCAVSAFASAKAALYALTETECDILLLDIDMPVMNGMDMAAELEKLSHKPLLVFVTSHDELVYNSFKYHPFGFVRKSCFGAEIEKVLEDCIKKLSEKNMYFSFRSDGGNIRLPLSEILYMESEGNYLKLYAESGEYRFRGSLSETAQALSDKGFVRIHKGFIVNQLAVKLLRRGELEVSGGAVIPMGRNYSEEAYKKLMRHMMK